MSMSSLMSSIGSGLCSPFHLSSPPFYPPWTHKTLLWLRAITHAPLCQEHPFPWFFFHTRCDRHLPREPFPDHPIWNSPSVFFVASIVLCQHRDLLSVSSTWSWAALGLCPGLLCSWPLTLHLAHDKYLGWSQTPASSHSWCPPGRGWVTIVLALSFQSLQRLLHRTEHVFTKHIHTGIKR